ncbi:Hpt domain-containing protein [Sediminicola sp. 1XM1-17]|uniref:Hpt domain-containing protein n=1 Tax=Sediminicola sp. 1XM1-17 TaxID=3127702 RepID=UPI003078509E
MKEVPHLNYIRELSGGDEVLEKKFIALIKQEFPKEKEVYLENLGDKRYRDTMQMVQKLKPKLNFLGLQEGYRLALRYEQDLRYEDPKLQKEFLEILERIESYIKTL